MNKYEYKIEDIRYIDSNQTRIDGLYPLWIGSTIYFNPDDISIGRGVHAQFCKNNNGEDYSWNMLHTSLVNGVVETDDGVVFQTLNSIYVLKEVDENESD